MYAISNCNQMKTNLKCYERYVFLFLFVSLITIILIILMVYNFNYNKNIFHTYYSNSYLNIKIHIRDIYFIIIIVKSWTCICYIVYLHNIIIANSFI